MTMTTYYIIGQSSAPSQERTPIMFILFYSAHMVVPTVLMNSLCRPLIGGQPRDTSLLRAVDHDTFPCNLQLLSLHCLLVCLPFSPLSRNKWSNSGLINKSTIAKELSRDFCPSIPTGHNKSTSSSRPQCSHSPCSLSSSAMPPHPHHYHHRGRVAG